MQKCCGRSRKDSKIQKILEIASQKKLFRKCHGIFRVFAVNLGAQTVSIAIDSGHVRTMGELIPSVKTFRIIPKLRRTIFFVRMHGLTALKLHLANSLRLPMRNDLSSRQKIRTKKHSFGWNDSFPIALSTFVGSSTLDTFIFHVSKHQVFRTFFLAYVWYSNCSCGWIYIGFCKGCVFLLSANISFCLRLPTKRPYVFIVVWHQSKVHSY